MTRTVKRASLLGGIGFVLLCLVLAANFKFNFLGIAEDAIFDGWQLNGQARVLGGIHADRMGLDKDGANLGKLARPGGPPPDWTDEATVGETFELFDQADLDAPVLFEYYRAQYGLQGVFYSFLSRNFGLDTLAKLQYVPALLTAIVLAGLFVLYARHYNRLFAILFLLSLGCAPYFLSMAKNLYWNPFLMLLPALAAAWAYGQESRPARAALIGLVGLLMTLKCLSNYEYITSVTLLACSIFLVAPQFKDPVHGRPDYRMAIAVFVVCVAGFVVAFLIHASVRGDTLIEGIRNIYIDDIARRTYGDPTAFAGETGESLRASALDVMRIYLLDYPGRRTMVIPGKVFLAMIALSCLGILAKFLRGHAHARRDAMAFAVFLSVPVSWFVLAKGHSFTQTHINFVLWYLGFMPALMFVTWSTVSHLGREFIGLFGRHRQRV